MSMKIRERSVGDVTILELSGRITLGEGAAQLRQAVKDTVEKGTKNILLNLSDITYVDSSGVAELCSADYSLRNHGGSLRVFGITRKVREILLITKLYTVFEAYENEEDALKSVHVPRVLSKCPVCHIPSEPPVFEPFTSLPSQTCWNCHSQFELSLSEKPSLQASVASLRLPTYADGYLSVLPGSPYTVEIEGRLDLFSSSALKKAWSALPTPRRVLFDLGRATEVSDEGRKALLALLANGEEEGRATISLEGLRQEQVSAFPNAPPAYSNKAEALAALGEVSDSPIWTTQLITLR